MAETKICSNPQGQCPAAGQQQPVENFNWLNSVKGYRQSFCKICKKQYNRFYEARSRGKTVDELRPNRPNGATLKRDSTGRKQCIGCAEYKNESCFSKSTSVLDGLHPRCKRCVADTQKGLTLERRRAMLKEQNGMCAGPDCDLVFDINGDAKTNYCIDHFHECCPGQKTCGNCIRSLLCRQCNVAARDVEHHAKWLAWCIARENEKSAPAEAEAPFS